MFLRQSTASQEVLLGPFLDDTDGKTAETGLTIANTDIKVWKSGGTTESNKNSGGATHIASGRYYAVLDATDTDTVGLLEINVHVSGALPVRRQLYVLEEAVYDALFAASAAGYQVPIWAAASSTVNLSGTTVKTLTDAVTLPSSATISITGNITGNLSGSVGSVTGAVGSVTGNVGGNVSGSVGSVVGAVGSVTSGVTVSANNDKTGYSLSSGGLASIAAWTVAITGNITGNMSGSVGSVAGNVEGNVSGSVGSISGVTFPSNFSALAITADGSVDADLETIKGQSVTCAAGVTIGVYVGGTGAAATATALSSVDGKIGTPVDIGLGATIAAGINELHNDLTQVHNDAQEVRDDWANGGRLDLILDAIAANVVLVLDDTGAAGVVLSAATCNKIADHVRRRTQANVEASSDGDTLSLLSLYGVIQQIQEGNAVGTTLTVYRTDGTTSLGTRTLATDPAADPVTGVS